MVKVCVDSVCLSGPQQSSFEFQKSQLDEHAVGVQVRGPFYLLLAFHLPSVSLSLSLLQPPSSGKTTTKKTHKPQPISTCWIWIQHFQSPRTIKSQYITELQPPHSHNPMNKTWHGKRACDQILPHQRKVIYCFRSSLGPDQCSCKRRRTQTADEEYLREREGFLQLLKSSRTYGRVQGRVTPHWFIQENAGTLQTFQAQSRHV